MPPDLQPGCDFMESTLGLFVEEAHEPVSQQLPVQGFQPDSQPSLSVSIKKAFEK